MRLLFPASPLNPRTPDPLVEEQFDAFCRAGYEASLFSFEALQAGRVQLAPAPHGPAEFLYRGWMLGASEYRQLHAGIAATGSQMRVSPDAYLAAHHLPSWYPLLREFTPETVVMAVDEATPERLRALGWQEFFIKDFVKSLKTSLGSRLTDPDQLATVLGEMQHFRGTIEGGLCLRRVERFDATSEVRYFVIGGVPFAPVRGDAIPEIVAQVSSRIRSPFFSVDVARRTDGMIRIVEIGDGQVSDLVGWTAERFVEIWQ